MPNLRRYLLAITILLALFSTSANAEDWRKTADQQTKIDHLVNLVPGTAHWMSEMGDRYRNLYWAGKHGMWDFAIYQSEEIEKLIAIVAEARPKRAQSANEFSSNVFPMLHEAVASKDQAQFDKAFATLHAECMACHQREEHAFIVIPPEPTRAPSVVFDPHQ